MAFDPTTASAIDDEKSSSFDPNTASIVEENSYSDIAKGVAKSVIDPWMINDEGGPTALAKFVDSPLMKPVMAFVDNPYSKENLAKGVMDGYVPPPSSNSELPADFMASPEYKKSVSNYYDSLTPEKRKELEARSDLVGSIAKQRASDFAKFDQAMPGTALGLNTSATKDQLDPRAEARSRDMARQGRDTTTKAGAGEGAYAALKGDPTGRLMPTFQSLRTEEREKELAEINRKFNEDLAYSNPLSRGLAAAYDGFQKGTLGLNMFLADATGQDSWGNLAASANKKVTEENAAMGVAKNSAQRNFEGAVSSIAQQMPMIVAGALTGQPEVALAGMFTQSFGQNFAEGKQAGQTFTQNTIRSTQMASLEVIGEKFGIGATTKGILAATKGNVKEAMKLMAKAAVREIPGEQLTTAGQFLVDKEGGGIGLSTEAGFEQYLNQAVDTAVQTVMQGGLMAGGANVGARAVNAYRNLQSPSKQFGNALKEDVETFNPDQFGEAYSVDSMARDRLDPVTRGYSQEVPKSAPLENLVAQSESVKQSIQSIENATSIDEAIGAVKSSMSKDDSSLLDLINNTQSAAVNPSPAIEQAQAEPVQATPIPAGPESYMGGLPTDIRVESLQKLIQAARSEEAKKTLQSRLDTLAREVDGIPANRVRVSNVTNGSVGSAFAEPSIQGRGNNFLPGNTYGKQSYSVTSLPSNTRNIPNQNSATNEQPALVNEITAPEAPARPLTVKEKRAKVRAEKLATLPKMTNKQLAAIAADTRIKYMQNEAALLLSERIANANLNRSIAAKKRTKKQRKGANPEVDSMADAIVKLGGINRSAVRYTPEELSVKGRNGNMVGYVFHKNGRSLDEIAEALADLGYIEMDENGKAITSDFMDKLDRVAMGEDVYTPVGMMNKIAEQHAMTMEEVQAKSEAEYAEIEDDADAIELRISRVVEQLDDTFIPFLESEIVAKSTEQQMRELGFTEEEINAERQTEAGGTDISRGTEQVAIREAQEGGAGVSTSNQSKQEEFSLESESRQDGEARLRQLEQEQKSKEAAERAKAEQERQQRIKREIDSRQAASAENFQLGQSAEDSLAGQGGLFSRKNEGGIGEQLELTEEEKNEDAQAIQKLNKVLKAEDGGGTIVPLRDTPSMELRAARDIAKRAFGKMVHFVEDNPIFSGVAYNGVIYLTPNESDPVFSLAGHEVAHTLEQTDPVKARQLKNVLRQYIKGKALSDKAKDEPDLEAYKVESEVYADLTGAMWIDPEFWREMIAYDTNLFRRAAYLFMQASAKLINVVKGSRYDASRIVKDVDAVRTIIAQTWAEHNKARDASKAESILDAANITGKDRIEALKDIKRGDITLDELARAHNISQNKVEEKQDAYTEDLQGEILPAAGRDSDNAKAKPAAKNGNMDTASGIPEDSVFGTRVAINKDSKRVIGAAKITSIDDAAQATAYLGRGAVERFDAIVTDKNGKPLAVIGGFKGSTTQASVYPAVIVAEAFSIPNAANIWFSHNHPSGKAELSPADKNLYSALRDAFRGSSIEPKGILAIAGSVDGVSDWQFTDGTTVKSGFNDGTAKPTKVPAIEREYTQNGKIGNKITSPQTAMREAEEIAQGKSGIIFFDAQLFPVAFVPADIAMPLRGTGRMDALYRAVSVANGNRSMIVNNGRFSDQEIQNLGALLRSVDAPIMDVIDLKTGTAKSWAYEGRTMENSAFFSRKEPEKAPTFYSALARAIPSMSKIADKNGMVLPAQAQLWLTSRQKEGKFKADELAWSGVEDFLKMQTGKVSVDDIAKFVADNGAKVTEVIKETAAVELERLLTTDDIEVEQQGDWWLVETKGARETKVRKSSAETEIEAKEFGVRYFNSHIRERNRERKKSATNTKYHSYELPGGENYRELLLTLPEKDDRAADEKEFAELNAKMEEDGLFPEESARWEELGRRLGEEGRNKRNNAANYKSPHWDESNIVAHIRFNDRVDADGNKVLFIEELQSDWGQAGKKSGFADSKNKLKKTVGDNERSSLLSRMRDIVASKMESSGAFTKADAENFVAGMGEKDLARVSGMRAELDDLIARERNDLEMERNQAKMPPKAPFVTDTKAWLSLGIKRMIRYAAENGYDKVAFINGEQSADRYDLSKSIESIGYDPKALRLEAYDKNRNQVFNKTGISAGDLEDHIGKAVAEKLLAQPLIMGKHLLDGENIKVGGEGMIAFYDKIVPQVANDVLKKVGGGKVENVRLSDSSFSSKNAAADDALLADLGVEVEGKRPPTQLGFTITPELRDQAMDGLPMFSKKRPTKVGDHYTSIEKDGSIIVHGEPAEIRAKIPGDVIGRVVKSGVAFTHSDAPRVSAALEGRNIAYGRQGKVLDKLPVKDGKYVGAPEKFNTPGKIPTLRKWLMKLTIEGERGRYWYENSSKEILHMVGGDVNEARKFVALLAIYSPQAKVDANSTFALRAWAQYKAGQKISVKSKSMDGKAQRALDNVDEFWSGEKTGNFFHNLLSEIDPATKGKQGATIDMWMMRAAQYSSDAPNANQYAFMENETNRIAQQLGWEPQQVQAAIWVAMKARMENKGVKDSTEAKSEKKKWMKYVNRVDEETGKVKSVRVVLDEQKHRDNWLEHAFAHEPTEADTSAAKFDFSDGVRRHIGQVSWEARPGRSTGVLPGVNDAPYHQQVEFQQAVHKSLMGENGEDLLAQKLGLMVDGEDMLAPGVWQGEVAAGMQKNVAMAPSKGDAGKYSVDEDQASLLNTYTAVLGLLTKQEGVGWHRPFYTTTKQRENGVELRIGKPFTPGQAKELWAAVDRKMRDAGVADWQTKAALISSPEGMRVVNFGALDNNKTFRDMVDSAAEDVTHDSVIEPIYFASSGYMSENDWKEQPNGEGYKRQVSDAGRSDILRWAADILAPRVQAVFNEYSEKYGWGDPGEISFSRKTGSAETGARGSARGGDWQGASSRSIQENASAERLANLPTSSPGPVRAIKEAAARYVQQAGLPVRQQAAYVAADPKRGARIAQAFEEMKHDPLNPEVKASYQALIKETLAQYQIVKEMGLKIDVIKPGTPDPYPEGPKQVLEDLANGHLWLYPTTSGFGTINDISDNPLLAPTDEFIGDHPLLANDIFRIVHDVFGHGKEGVGFGPSGEENAWQSHVRMYSPQAARALTAETRGQNSWVNFGPHGKNNRANPQNTIYADQKIGLLPAWVMTDGVEDALEADIRFSRTLQAETIVVDGKSRQTTNSEGNPIAQTEEGVKNFWRWFGDSKVVDEQGRPLVVYHGSSKQFYEFKELSEHEGFGFHFGTAAAAKQITEQGRNAGGQSRIYPVYLRINNYVEFDISYDRGRHDPMQIYQMMMRKAEEEGVEGITEDNIQDYYEDAHKFKGKVFVDLEGNDLRKLMHSWMKSLGYDGIAYVNGLEDAGSTSYIAFTNKQIKSATENNGDFDASNADIRFSKKQLPATIEVDGKTRPTTNSNGKPLAQTEEGIRNFWKWFGDSENVDSDGNPKVFIHESPDPDFKLIDTDKGRFGGIFALDNGEANYYQNKFPLYVRGKIATEYDLRDVFYEKDYKEFFERELKKKLSDDENEQIERVVSGRSNDVEVLEQAFGEFDGDLYAAIQKMQGRVAKDNGFAGVRVDDEFGKDSVLLVSSKDIKSATGNNGEFDGDNPDIRFSKAPANQSSIEEETRSQAFQRQVQDKFNRFRIVQEALEIDAAKAAGYEGDNIHEAREFMEENGVQNPIDDSSDVYQAETNMSGRIAARIEDFRELTLKPLIERTQKMGATMEQVADYLKMQHAQEANKRAREIRGDQSATAYGVSDSEARMALADYRKMPNFAEFKALANDWREITESTKQMKLDAGILADDMVSAWEATYDNYVPVKGNDDSPKQGTGKGLSVNGKTKLRLGHELRDEAIIENILRDHEQAIISVEKNNVGKVLIKFAIEANDPDLITVSKPQKRQVLKDSVAYEVFYKGRPLESFTSREAAQAYIQGQVSSMKRNPADFDVKRSNDPRVVMQASPLLADNEVNVYVGGQSVRIQLNDEYLARAYTNLGVDGLNAMLSAAREVNNYLSKAYTGYNPEFVFVNPIRDAIQGSVVLTSKYGAGITAKIYANYPSAAKELFKHMRNHGSSALVNDFRLSGSTVGGAKLSDIERIGDDVMAAYNEYAGAMNTYQRVKLESLANGDSQARAHSKALLASGVASFKRIPVIGHFLRFVESANAITENALRVATYKTLLAEGKSRPEAAAAAKDLMNFNRKGEITNTAGAFYLFFNPNVQGTAVLIESLTKAKHKNQARALVGMMVLSAYLLAELARSDDEDEWKRTPASTKDRNMIINAGGYQLSIPVPYGYGVFHALGNIISDYKHGESGWKLGTRFAATMFENFSPVGNPMAGDSMDYPIFQIFPTHAKMAIAPELNETSLGSPIAPEKFSKYKLDSQNMYRNTKGTVYSAAAEGLNSLTGGNKYEAGMIDVSPEVIKYWVNTITGGTGRFAVDTVSLVGVGAQGVTPEVKELPVIRKFIREPGTSDTRSAYYAAVKEAEKAAASFAAAKKARDKQAAMQILQDNEPLIKLAKFAEKQREHIKAKRDMQDEIRQDDSIKLNEKRIKLKALERDEEAIYNQFLEAFERETAEFKKKASN